uniref:Uncharacterized protein n=1 Tax=Rhodopseudomonas palustris (strain BisA53) TaxID=316055 RepID=Q07V59_RHOP5
MRSMKIEAYLLTTLGTTVLVFGAVGLLTRWQILRSVRKAKAAKALKAQVKAKEERLSDTLEGVATELSEVLKEHSETLKPNIAIVGNKSSLSPRELEILDRFSVAQRKARTGVHEDTVVLDTDRLYVRDDDGTLRPLRTTL